MPIKKSTIIKYMNFQYSIIYTISIIIISLNNIGNSYIWKVINKKIHNKYKNTRKDMKVN